MPEHKCLLVFPFSLTLSYSVARLMKLRQLSVEVLRTSVSTKFEEIAQSMEQFTGDNILVELIDGYMDPAPFWVSMLSGLSPETKSKIIGCNVSCELTNEQLASIGIARVVHCRLCSMMDEIVSILAPPD